MEEILNIIDLAVKRLVAPTAMIVAAAVISKGVQQPNSSELAIKCAVWFLVLSALIFMVLSAIVSIKRLNEVEGNKIITAFSGVSFVFVYIALFFVGVYLALGKF